MTEQIFAEIPNYLTSSDIESLLDDDIKKMIDGKSVYMTDVINLQLIKSIKELNKTVKEVDLDLSSFTFDHEGNLYVKQDK